ncbi:MAG TPA: GPW/gp25 family protein [Longimicrobium sp.]|nr:GPW/gp25 family protein [Longimicrobium sp.]
MNIDYPLHLAPGGRTALAGDDDHVRDMIEQLLLTSPGERVNRPDFGSGLMAMVFAPGGNEVAAALEFTVRAALQRWLGDIAEVHRLDVDARDSALYVTVDYVVRRTREVRTATFTRETP